MLSSKALIQAPTVNEKEDEESFCESSLCEILKFNPQKNTLNLIVTIQRPTDSKLINERSRVFLVSAKVFSSLLPGRETSR